MINNKGGNDIQLVRLVNAPKKEIIENEIKMVHESQISSLSQVSGVLRTSLKSSLKSLCVRLKYDLSTSKLQTQVPISVM